jgi:hypothetical protein
MDPHLQQRLLHEVDGWLDLGCPERAIERVTPLLASPQVRHLAIPMRVRALITMARFREALDDIAELERGDHDFEWCMLTKAWCHKRIAELPRAIDCMRALVGRNGQSGIGHFNLGCYLALAGLLDEAMDEVAVACGIEDDFRELMVDEPDLTALREDPRFQALARPPQP